MKIYKKSISVIVVLTLLITLLFAFAKSGVGAQATGSGAQLKDGDIQLMIDNENFSTDKSSPRSYITGSVYRVRITKDLINGITGTGNEGLVSVVYSVINLNDSADVITMESEKGEIYRNGLVVKDADFAVVDGKIKKDIEVKKEDLKLYEASDAKYYGYFEIQVFRWCAVMFKVKYNGAEKDEMSYASQPMICKNIDTQGPVIDFKDFQKIGDKMEITVEIEDKTADLSVASGVDKETIRLIRKVGDNLEELKLKEIVGSGSKYTVKFTVDGTVQGSYFINAGDKVKLAKDPTHIYTVNNDIYIKENGEKVEESHFLNMLDRFKQVDFNVKAYDEFNKVYLEYRLLVQAFNGDGLTEEQKKSTRNQIEGNALPKLQQKYKEMFVFYDNARKKIKEYSVNVINSEYLNKPLEVLNADEAYYNFLYGEKLIINVTVADFNPKTVNKKEELRALSMPNADRVIALTLDSVNNYSQKFSSLTSALKIKVPVPKYSKIKAVQKITSDSVVRYEPLKVVTYKGYVIVEALRGDGVVNVVLEGSRANTDLYWLFTLLIIPIGIAGAVIYKKALKNRAQKNKKSIEQAKIQDKQASDKKPPSNKSKKKKHKTK